MRNLTEVSLKNKSLVWYFIILCFVAGIFSYVRLGRMEDPSFTIKEMVISVAWPGATAREMELQVTDKIERKLHDTEGLDYIKSFSRDGEAVIYVNLRDEVPTSVIRERWQEVRNSIDDIKKDLPQGVYGPYYNDHFDDVYGTIYALTGDGYSYTDLKDQAKDLREKLWKIPTVNKVELLGEQDEKVYVEIDRVKLSTLGINPQQVAQAIQAQQAMLPSGSVETKNDKIYLNLTGKLQKAEDLNSLPLNIDGRVIPLGSVATIQRMPIDPSEPKLFYNGKPAIGVAISMEKGGNILTLGKKLDADTEDFKNYLPAGLELSPVVNQAHVVKDAISEFVDALMEAVIIVLAVSFLSLGVRTGMVVAGCIPLVIAGTFVGMDLLHIDLHKVSLGALIISLGLLVDDAIIAVEMMTVKLEQGLDRFDAACYAYNATAKPMLSGTLITCAGFIPVAFSDGLAAEFCKALFPVITIALLLSWISSVMVAPLYGYSMIKIKGGVKKDPYDNKFYREFKKVLVWCLGHRKKVLVATLILFIVSIGGFKFIAKEFFPPSVRPELIVSMRLPVGSSLKATEDASAKLADYLNQEEFKDKYNNYTYYTGVGAPRFVLAFNPNPPENNFAQFVITAKNMQDRDEMKSKLETILAEDFPEVESNIQYLQMGPPYNYPVMIRVTGKDIAEVKTLAEQIGNVMRKDDNLYNINYDWQAKSKSVKLVIDQEKLRSMGLSNEVVSKTLYTELTGASVAQFYDTDKTIDIVLRLPEDERDTLNKIRNLPINMGKYGYIPLEQIAHVEYSAQDGLIWRRDMEPSIIVQADIHSGTANDATEKVYNQIKDIRDNLPRGYTIAPDGSMENSEKALKYLESPIPIMVLAILTILMFQLRSIQLVVLTLLTAPLGIIGVSFGMLIFHKPIGFVAILGILALFGMIIRNSIILIDQIKKHLADGEDPYHAVIDSAVLRFRPIMLTAAAAILGMLPLVPSNLWGSMAIAISCGLLIATILTLLVLPTMYVTWFKIYPPEE